MAFIRPHPDMNKIYSYADYLTWDTEERFELINGIPYMMAPAPSRRHQEILFELAGQFRNVLKESPCKGYVAPFDVRLPEKENQSDDEIFTVVQPDLAVVCDPEKLDERGCVGAPNLVVEILSPSTASHDYIRKMNLYETHGVKEYWIVHPNEELVMVFLLEDGKYGRPHVYDKEGVIRPKVVPEAEIVLKDVFAE